MSSALSSSEVVYVVVAERKERERVNVSGRRAERRKISEHFPF